MNISKKLIILCVGILVTACTSSHRTSEEYWFAQGERFGVHGYAYDNDTLESIKDKVSFDETAYRAGYIKGKEAFCDPHRAFEKGIKGQKYNGQCAGMDQEVMIEAEWRRGWDAFIGADFYKFK